MEARHPGLGECTERHTGDTYACVPFPAGAYAALLQYILSLEVEVRACCLATGNSETACKTAVSDAPAPHGGPLGSPLGP